MDADQTKPQDRTSKRIFKWILGITTILCLTCCGVPTLIYVFLIPSLYESRVGQELPDSAEVLHGQWDQNGFDASYRFVISFRDDSARDQIIRAWNLQPGEARRLSSSDLPVWWPESRIDQINESGESYRRVNDQTEHWWSLWVDRENQLLYVEQGRW